MTRDKSLSDYLTTPEARERNKHLLGENNLPIPVQPTTSVLSYVDERAKGGKAVLLLKHDIKSLNHFKNNWQRKKEREIFYDSLLTKLKRKLTPLDERQLVTLTRILGGGQKKYDYENLTAGSCKQLIDAMKLIGFWKDDSPKWLERVYLEDATRRDKGPAVLVEIEVI